MGKTINTEPSISDLLLATLASARNTYTFKRILYEQKTKRYKEESLRVGLSKINKKGLVENNNGWRITNKGLKHFKERSLLSYLPSPFAKNVTKNTIVSFDIPQKSNTLRNWLRNQIKIFGYSMVQQSLWIGPGPLPKEFLIRLEKLGIRSNIKIFRVRKLN